MPRERKGDRQQFTVRVPVEHGEVYEREASHLGMEWSDYLALKLAEAHGLERPAWLRSSTEGQEVLSEAG